MIAPVPESPRLRFRQYTPADEMAVFALFADTEARRFYPEMADRAHARRWIDWNLENYRAFGYGLWALESKDSGTFAGDCGLTWQNVDGGSHLEIGYHVMSACRRRGYATEAARACLDFALQHTDAPMICSIVHAANAASRAVAQRIHHSSREFLWNATPALLFYTTRSVQPSTPNP